jgi:hypothetical protein
MLNRSRTDAARTSPDGTLWELCDWDGAPVSAVVGVRQILQTPDE